MDEKILVECDDAGLQDADCEGEVQLTICPYEEEVNNVQQPAWLCDKHYNLRSDEI